MAKDERVDTYIARQADFARPILDHIRSAVHAACPEVEETLKWGAPSFLYKGKLLAMMAAFKQHAVLNFWRGEEIVGGTGQEKEAMGQFGRLESVDDLPGPEALAGLIRKAMARIEAGAAPRRASPKPELPVPEDLGAALDEKAEAAAHFAAFTPGQRRDYVEWVVDAKRPETRARRIAQAAEWISQGKKRNWKYEKC